MISIIYNLSNRRSKVMEADQEPTYGDSMPTNPKYSNKYFQVNVNSDKLSKILQNINEQLRQQDARIQRIHSDFTKTMDNFTKTMGNFEHKLSNASERNGMMFTRVDKRIQENINKFQLYLNDLNKQLKKQGSRDEQLQQSIESNNKKIKLYQDQANENLQQAILQIKQQIIGEQVESKDNQTPTLLNNLSSAFSYLNDQMMQIRMSIAPQIQDMLGQYQKSVEKTKEETIRVKKQQFTQRKRGKQNGKKVNVLKGGLSKGVCPVQVSTIEQQDMQRQQLQIGDERRALNSRGENEYQLNSVFMELKSKVTRLADHMDNSEIEAKKRKNKLIICEQKTDILSRKVQKTHHQVNELKSHIRRMESLRLDDKAVEELKIYTKMAVKDLQLKMQQKCSHEDLDHERTKILQRISILHLNIADKAERAEIKKALVFLEEKIKEIILFISSEQAEEKGGSIIKTAFKCLSCDKGVDKAIENLDENKSLSSSRRYLYSRSMTHQAKQKYRSQVKGSQSKQELGDR